jgi:hypothetical protein
VASLKLIYSAATGEFAEALKAMEKPIASAATAAIRDMGQQMKREGRAVIAAAGFSVKWQNAYQLTYYPNKGKKESIGASAFAWHEIKYSAIYQRGGKISGSPLLWLPLKGLPERINGKRTTPAIYEAAVGKLIAMHVRPGRAPLLGGYVRGHVGARLTLSRLRTGEALGRLNRVGFLRSRFGRLRGGRGLGLQLVPLFVGIRAVNIKKRFDLRPLLERAKAGLPAAYLKHLREVNK